MANEPVLLLTPLRKEGHNFKGATSAGSWQPLSGTLGELGKALDVDDEAAVDVVRSTPDPWSQARSFADAVLNPATQRNDIVGQWRGLLALFALAAYYEDSYKLELTPLPLADSKTRFIENGSYYLLGFASTTRAVYWSLNSITQEWITFNIVA